MRDQGQRRPWIISVLAILWLTGLVLSPMMALRVYTRTGGADAFSVTFALVSGLMTYGLWRGKRWARMCQILLLVPALALLPLTGAAIITIGYLNRPKTRAYFAPTPGAATWDGGTFLQSEWPWILSILLTLGGGWILLSSLAPLYRQWG